MEQATKGLKLKGYTIAQFLSPHRYTGKTGEVSATFRRAGQPAELDYRSGNAVHYLATGATTEGRFGLYRWDFSTQPSGPSPHFHRTISESFFILSGTVRLYDGKDWVDATAGDFSYVPEGGIHAFRNESGKEASMLILFAPGAPREEYFETLARFAGNPDVTEAERAEIALRHDNIWILRELRGAASEQLSGGGPPGRPA